MKSRPIPDLDVLRSALRAGRKAVLAEVLARLEAAPDAPDVLALLNAAYVAPTAHVIGITGPPGVGKSTLTGALIAAYRCRGCTIGVIAVDPSSKASGGALLGDRTRLASDPEDKGLFIRSMAARDRLGGLAGLTIASMVVMRAVFDIVVIETVGVGQSETDVVGAADTVVFCVQPGAGDSLQFMKAGIVEIPHVVAVTKADLGAPARRTLSDIESALGLAERRSSDGWQVPILAVAASQPETVDGLIAAMNAHRGHLLQDERLVRARRLQADGWVVDGIRERFGREGLKRARDLGLPTADGGSPFDHLRVVVEALLEPGMPWRGGE